jgi:hypothetical protein
MDTNGFVDRSLARGVWYVHHGLPSCVNMLLRRDESGIIKSPVSTTALQVVTRVIQVWMVWYSFPQSTAASHAYLALLLAWSVADTIRYLYLALNMHGKAPRGLVWLRYVLLQLHLLS